MPAFEIVLLALGLAMDATAVAGARGMAAREVRVRDAALVALFFGGGQAIMPILGGLAGEVFATRIAGWGHWLTIAILGVIGAKMIYEALELGRDANAPEHTSDSAQKSPFDLRLLAALAVATSIDALAAGLTLAVTHTSILAAALVIGAVTAALSFAGVYLGSHFGSRLGKRLEVVGGLVLLGLALKTLVEHIRGQ